MAFGFTVCALIWIGSLMSEDYSFANAYLEALRISYFTSGNAFIVWVAIHLCRNETPQRPLPDWCLNHLAEVAEQIDSLISPILLASAGSIGKGEERAPPIPKASEILHALRLTPKGKNSFRVAGYQLRSIRAAVQYDILREARRSSSEALMAVMAWLGESHESSTKVIIRTGLRLMRGKRAR